VEQPAAGEDADAGSFPLRRVHPSRGQCNCDEWEKCGDGGVENHFWQELIFALSSP